MLNKFTPPHTVKIANSGKIKHNTKVKMQPV